MADGVWCRAGLSTDSRGENIVETAPGDHVAYGIKIFCSGNTLDIYVRCRTAWDR